MVRCTDALSVVCTARGRPTGDPPAGDPELHRGRSLPPPRGSDGVVPSRTGSHRSVRGVWRSGGRPVRLRSQLQGAPVRRPHPLPRGLGGGRSRNRLVVPPGLRFSPVCPSGDGDREGQGSGVPDNVDRPLLALSTLVTTSPVDVDGGPENSSPPSGSSDAPRTGDAPRAPRVSPPCCVETVERGLREEGLSEEAASLAARGRRDSTFRLYDARLRVYREWCDGRQVSPLTAPLGVVADFLTAMFSEGKQVNTVRGYRTAIHRGFPGGSSVSSARPLDLLIRAMALKRPRIRTLAPPWDMTAVLRLLASPPFEPMSSCPLLELSMKTAFLVAAASARRRSAVHALSILPGHIRFEPHGVRLVADPAFLTKTQSIDFLPAPIFLASIAEFSSITEDKVWCPVRAIKWYLHRTRPLRGDCTALFVISRKPYTRAAKDTISRWIVEVIARAVPEVPRPRAHDVRAMVTSAALYKGVPLEEILQAAAWKSSHTFISSYLRDVLRNEARMSSAFLGSPSAPAHV